MTTNASPASHVPVKGEDLWDLFTAKRICEHLDKHYPGYLWKCRSQSKQGIVQFWSERLSGKYGMLMHFPQFQDDPELKIVTAYGGELLERFGVRIGLVDNDQLHEKKEYAGEYAFDPHEMAGKARASAAVRMRWDAINNQLGGL